MLHESEIVLLQLIAEVPRTKLSTNDEKVGPFPMESNFFSTILTNKRTRLFKFSQKLSSLKMKICFCNLERVLFRILD